MAEIKIAGVMRAGAYSPNHIGNDAAIFNVVTEQLRKRGCEVNVYSEDQFAAGLCKERYIINMCREPRSIKRLQQLEDTGVVVLNSGYGIENCVRERMTRILMGNGIPFPASVTVNTNEVVRDALDRAGYGQCWIKRGDSHTMHKEDVTFVRHAEEAQEVLQEYFMRGIDRAVISKHLRGQMIKFYGVRDQQFFHWFFTHDGYGLSERQKELRDNFDAEGLRDMCLTAAEALGVDFYGGDVILGDDGTMRIIDFNDWPSYAPCRTDAAAAIAKSFLEAIKRKAKKP